MSSRIGLIAYGLDRESGGVGRYSKELMTALRSRGLELTVLWAGKAPNRQGSIPLHGSTRLPGLLTIGQIEVARITQQQKLALIHDPTGCAPLWLTRARRVVTIHDVIPYIYPETSSTLDWLIYHFWLPFVVSRLNSIITVSERSKTDLLQYLPVNSENITVIPEAASPIYRPIHKAQLESTLLSHGLVFPYILYVGSIEARKNLNTLLEAYAQLRCWSQKWKLVIVGAYKWKYSSIFATLERLQLTADVHFTGYLAEEDLPVLYNGASLFVFPSLYEGFGLPVLEAMACGTPVVTSNCSSLPEVAGEAAILVDPKDANAIALAIRQILQQPDLAASMSRKGIARAQEFSWEQTARKTTDVYERLLSESFR